MINGIRLLYVEYSNGLAPVRAKEMMDWHWMDVEPENSLNAWEILTLSREENGDMYWCDSLGFKHKSNQPVGTPPTNTEVKELLHAFGAHCRQLNLYGTSDTEGAGDYISQGLPSEIALAFSSHLR